MGTIPSIGFRPCAVIALLSAHQHVQLQRRTAWLRVLENWPRINEQHDLAGLLTHLNAGNPIDACKVPEKVVFKLVSVEVRDRGSCFISLCRQREPAVTCRGLGLRTSAWSQCCACRVPGCSQCAALSILVTDDRKLHHRIVSPVLRDLSHCHCTDAGLYRGPLDTANHDFSHPLM